MLPRPPAFSQCDLGSPGLRCRPGLQSESVTSWLCDLGKPFRLSTQVPALTAGAGPGVGVGLGSWALTCGCVTSVPLPGTGSALWPCSLQSPLTPSYPLARNGEETNGAHWAKGPPSKLPHHPAVKPAPGATSGPCVPAQPWPWEQSQGGRCLTFCSGSIRPARQSQWPWGSRPRTDPPCAPLLCSLRSPPRPWVPPSSHPHRPIVSSVPLFPSHAHAPTLLGSSANLCWLHSTQALLLRTSFCQHRKQVATVRFPVLVSSYCENGVRTRQ